jgi:hypothetical protein
VKVMRRLILLATMLFVLTPGGASAQRCVAPPGTAAVDQYCETVPTAGGDRDSSGPRAPVTPVAPSTSAALARAGKDGEALNRALGQQPGKASQGVKGTRRDGAASGSGSGSAAIPSAPSDNPLTAVRQSLASGDTIGSGFVWALLLVTIGVLTFAWIGFRRRQTD